LSRLFEFRKLIARVGRCLRRFRSAAAIDRLDLGVEFKAGATRLAKCRRAGALEPAKRRVDQVAGRGAVDLDGARFDVIGEVMNVARIPRRDRRGQPVLRLALVENSGARGDRRLLPAREGGGSRARGGVRIRRARRRTMSVVSAGLMSSKYSPVRLADHPPYIMWFLNFSTLSGAAEAREIEVAISAIGISSFSSSRTAPHISWTRRGPPPRAKEAHGRCREPIRGQSPPRRSATTMRSTCRRRSTPHPSARPRTG
jgi:hypothetical protein